MSRAARLVPVGMLLAAALAGCAAPTPAPTPSATVTAEPTAIGPVQPTGAPSTLVGALTTPWSVVRAADDVVLVSSRDTGEILRLRDGDAVLVGSVPGVVHTDGGEDGLLGLAAREIDGVLWVYAYLTTASDNRIVRMPYADDALGEAEVVLDGIRSARVHDGGRIAFGPDGMLYAGVGDAGVPELSQDPAALNGKILRMTPTGAVPADNPSPGSLVYSLGHRNVQGLAWDDEGRMWASEFGQNTWDELNLIEPGGNYGWPVVEGVGGEGFVDPVLQWATSEASPSGLAAVEGSLFLAGLRGQRLWVVDPDAAGGARATAWFEGDYGRLRDAVAGPDGTLWLLTSNTDGRGAPRTGDDRLLEVRLVPVGEG